YSAVGLGVVLVISAILMNIYSSLRRRNYTNALFGPNGAAGLVFYVSIVYGLARQVAFGENVFHKTYVICLIVLPLVIMYFRDILGGLVSGDPNWRPESVSDYIMENFFEVFEFVLSYLTNTISFIRVGAFVLVHAGMMMVVFMLAEMTSGIFYALIIILGNVFVMALEGLLVSIQALRLEFYE
ncbi:MAG TPA: ATPase, partial [Ruminococcaceae bacterium]|nr:ATPase [Oscillospiraceae bacterium]